VTLAENVAAITIAFFGQPLAAETLQVSKNGLSN
jgi:hypothetical protein